MISSRHFGAPARLLSLFLLLAVIPLAALGWLGWRLLDQDRALDLQRVRERLEDGAALVAAESARALTQWDGLLAGSSLRAASLPPESALMVIGGKGLVRREGAPLPYYPVVNPPVDPDPAIFAEAEAQEFRGGGLAGAAALYRKLAVTPNPEQRAAALMRLARTLRKDHRNEDAIRVYGEISSMAGTSVAGAPAELVGRRERIVLYRSSGNPSAAARESALLAAALQHGRYAIDRPTFEFYRQSVAEGLPIDANASELARAVEDLWPVWQQQSSGRAVVKIGDRAFTAVWRRSSEGTAALAGGADALLAPALSLARSLQLRAAIEDQSGRLLAGSADGNGGWASKSFRETGLPWSIRVAVADPFGLRQGWASRRNLFSGGFALMALVIGAAAYFVFRAVQRELGVARLQSDFVSAVSHEFRTPLTAMCHLTEMLEENGAPPERLPQYYGALARETRRLHGMVESLLDFGRMEAGRRTYCLQEIDATELARRVVEEFQERSGPGRLALHVPPDPFVVRADPEAIVLALRNLVDNALKYSPESSAIDVSIARRGDLTGISVEDRGPGISKEEQRTVFRKFVRGEAARAGNVKGTGIGLSLVDHIVKAHGGSVELASEPGHGSRFTILLPVQPGPA